MKDGPSYHDVTVYVGNVRYRITDNYALQVTCSRAAGWRLWKMWDGEETLIGGEFDGEPFCLEVAGMVICGRRPSGAEPPKPFGWDGRVDTDKEIWLGPWADL